MNLTINIGNTNVSAGLFDNNRIVMLASAPSQQRSYDSFIRKFAKPGITGVIISSVVPPTTVSIITAVKKFFPGVKPVVLGKTHRLPVKNLCSQPDKVGQDRLVAAYAAAKLYGTPAIVVDFGTAITFNVVNAKGQFAGGLILPGLQTALNAMTAGTALLPTVKLKAPSALIGKNTSSAMLSGIVNGYSCLADGIIARLRSELGPKCVIIGTGGHINFIKKFTKSITRADQSLVLKGLNAALASV